MKHPGWHHHMLLAFVLMSLVQAAFSVLSTSGRVMPSNRPSQPHPPGYSSEQESNGQRSHTDPLDTHARLLCKRVTCKDRCWDPLWLKKPKSYNRTQLMPSNEERELRENQEFDLGSNKDERNNVELHGTSDLTVSEVAHDAEEEDEDKKNIKVKRNLATFDAECHCDESCIIFGDCCYDFFSLCLQQNLTTLMSGVQNTSGMSEIIQNITKSIKTTEESVWMFLYKSCEKIRYKDETQHYWMISQCTMLNTEETLDDEENETVSKCHNTTLDPVGSVPASLKQQPDIVFRNIFCAQCNGVDKDSVIMWRSEAKCSGNYSPSGITYDEFMNKFRTSKCTVVSEVPSNTSPRRCKQDRDMHFGSCSTDGDDGAFLSLDSLMCRSYVYPVVTDKGIMVRNSHCAFCSTFHTFQNFTCDPLTHFKFHNIEVPYCDGLSCKGLCNQETTGQKCHCDVRCLIYGDCCYDFISTCLGNNITLPDFADNATLIIPLLMHKLKPDEHETRTQGLRKTDIISTTVINLQGLYIRYRRCVHVPPGHLIWVIAKCPQNNEDPLCESATYFANNSFSPPASYIQDEDIVFKNIYCGRCHGVPEEMLTQWDISFQCKPDTHPFTNMETFLSEHCTISIKSMGGRSCMEVDINYETQVHNDAEAVSLCGSYRYSVYSSKHSTHYRNPHCASDIYGEKDLSCTVKTEGSQKKSDNEALGGTFVGFSVLFNFNDKDVQFKSTDGKVISPYVECKSTEVYDVYQKMCRQLRCQEGKEAVNGSCVVSGVVYADRQNQLFPNGTQHYTVSVYVITEVPLQINNIKDLSMMGSLLRHAGVAMGDIEIHNVSALSVESSFHGIKWESSQDLKQMIKIHVKNDRSLAEDIRLLSELAQQLLSESDPMIVDITLQNFDSESDLFCSYGALMHLTNVTLETLNGTLYAADSYKLYILESIAFVLGLKAAARDLQQVFVCGIPLKCDPVVYNITDFIEEEGNLRNLDSGVILTNTSFFIAGDEVLSCHNFTQFGPERYSQLFFKYDHVQDILTYVTSGISMVSLLITLVVYSLLPELRNLPGRLTMSLSATLLVAQTLLLLIPLPTGLLCQALAITLHFSWLFAFMWMTVLSITLARTFTSKGLNALNQNTARTHGFLSLCASGIPLIIVTTSALLDFLKVPNIYIGYGARGICWIANPRASLLVFGVPLALMLLVNIIAFIMTLCNIEKSLKLSENITSSKKDKAKVFIYGKLFVIMGVSWCTSFGAAFADVSVLWYFFIILNGLQGFYIFVSFVCTDRVKRLLRKKFTGSSADMRTTSAVTATTEIKSQKGDKTSI